MYRVTTRSLSLLSETALSEPWYFERWNDGADQPYVAMETSDFTVVASQCANATRRGESFRVRVPDGLEQDFALLKRLGSIERLSEPLGPLGETRAMSSTNSRWIWKP